ncbi:hypothetical protein GCM10009547_12250 [Sporichthya brevicatena]|uniref:Sirohydrochlorin ferrochelatase n=1 Tax=Sporichthya brevicatena TaxID=171442 RepID=A0ABP3RKD6_9ACTN
MSAPTLVAVAHGSRNPAAQANIRALLAAVRAARPGLEVREAFVELAAPSLPEVLRAVEGEVVVVPLLLGNGYHVAHDVAGVADFHRPGTPCAPALGPDPLLALALADRLAAAESAAESATESAAAAAAVSKKGDTPYCAVRGVTLCERGPVVLAAAGSSDPRSHADVDAMAVLLEQQLGRPVIPAYNSATTPSVRDAVTAARAMGRRSVSVATYLLSPGRFATEVQACGADVVSAPLGVHPALVGLVLARYDAARALTPSSSARRATLG